MEHHEREDIKSVNTGDLDSCGELLSGMERCTLNFIASLDTYESLEQNQNSQGSNMASLGLNLGCRAIDN